MLTLVFKIKRIFTFGWLSRIIWRILIKYGSNLVWYSRKNASQRSYYVSARSCVRAERFETGVVISSKTTMLVKYTVYSNSQTAVFTILCSLIRGRLSGRFQYLTQVAVVSLFYLELLCYILQVVCWRSCGQVYLAIILTF